MWIIDIKTERYMLAMSWEYVFSRCFGSFFRVRYKNLKTAYSADNTMYRCDKKQNGRSDRGSGAAKRWQPPVSQHFSGWFPPFSGILRRKRKKQNPSFRWPFSVQIFNRGLFPWILCRIHRLFGWNGGKLWNSNLPCKKGWWVESQICNHAWRNGP